MTFTIRAGLDLPISGKPKQDILPGPTVTKVGIMGDDYVGMRPTMRVEVGDSVKLGQPLFEDKKTPGVLFTSPGSGKVSAITRGEKRKFESIEIELDGEDEVKFASHADLSSLSRDEIEAQLVESGQWVAFRTRPFSKVPAIGSQPNSIFVTAMDTNPLSAEPELIIAQHKDLFVAGLQVIRKLTEGRTYVCHRHNSRIPGENVPNVHFEEFRGPHPAGLPGTHIHYLDPVGPKKTVWHIGYQEVIAFGHLFTTGRIMTERVVAFSGPVLTKAALYSTRLGVCLDDFVAMEKNLENVRVISGSVLDGRKSEPARNFLGRHHVQISVLKEGNQREFLGWQMPRADLFSLTPIYVGSWIRDKLFPMSTSTGGSKRAMVPMGTYEKVVPLDVLPTQLLRALIYGDTEEAQMLGALELAEDDLALCTYVCPGKYEYGKLLRENLTVIEKEG